MRTFSRVLFALLLALTCQIPSALAQDNETVTKRTMIADTTAFEPGKPFYVAFHFKIDPDFHLYWRFPGSVGEPFSIQSWTLPAGWKAEPIEFPLPTKITVDDKGTIQNFFGYEEEVFFPVKITPAKNASAEPVTIKAKAKWNVCDHETCKQGSEEFSLSLNSGPVNRANKELFDKWMAQLPQTSEPPTKDLKISFQDKKLAVLMTGLPDKSSAEFFPIPPTEYTGTLEFAPVELETKADGTQVETFTFDSDIKWSGLLVVKDASGARKGWYIGNPPDIKVQADATGSKAVEKEEVASDGQSWDPFDDIAATGKKMDSSGGLWALLLQGLLGGLLLNLMPCVLPVISLKIFGFMEQAHQSRQRIFRLGLAYCAGIFAFFFALALLILGLSAFNKSLGWGAQFSNPVVLTVLIAIMFGFGLSLLGVFEITLGGKTSNKLSEVSAKEGFGGAFTHGFFTTLLGTSCTAPLVAPVLGAAVNKPGIQIFALFGSIAIGLALPYFLLTWQPAWMRFLPKPGMWMVRFKQILGFVMLGFAVWLLSTVPDKSMMAMVGYFLFAIALAAWIYGTYPESRTALLAALVLVVGGWFAFIHGKVVQPEQKNSGLLTEIRAGLNDGRPVFVDFTADWCLNCKAFEKAVLDTEPVQEAFKAKNVKFVKADYTNSPPDISDALKKMGRAGVPAYVLFRKRGDFWLADGLFSATPLLEELNKLPSSSASR